MGPCAVFQRLVGEVAPAKFAVAEILVVCMEQWLAPSTKVNTAKYVFLFMIRRLRSGFLLFKIDFFVHFTKMFYYTRKINVNKFYAFV